MEQLPISDHHLQPEIDGLRSKHPETQDLYREVCVLLFFRYGITPTANKLYQLVKKGSMSAPAEALNRFWENLRDKSRIRIEHPDLPQSLQDAAGEMVGALWQQAQSVSERGYQQLRDDASAASLQAQAKASQAEDLAAITEKRLNAAQSQLQSLAENLVDLKSALARTQGESSALQAQITAGIEQRRELQESHKLNQQSWQAELEQQRRASMVAQENSAADMRRVLLDIDRERLAGARLQKELAQTRSDSSVQSELQRQKFDEVQKQSHAVLLINTELDKKVEQLRAELKEQINKNEKVQLPNTKPVPLNASRVRKLNAARFK
ncbi:Chromosome partition protein Smc [Polaromonas vacuolata]|uniref:Chromosome partition protein Smc n=1 Tax=Polaromonas vacuolata TaxID=37448 RepID=A0A6H2H931_9BURK|nr:DNA-binding protein [Polaromonas vacuolata]QJC56379.1 Chromosome partition protein Smc [Polaromonas vacuolata]